MSLYAPTWNDSLEPAQSSVNQWLDHIWTRVSPIEQSRWNQAHIDSLFYANDQSYINTQFNFDSNYSSYQYYFNLVQQPVNMVTGYQRQHRKGLLYLASEGGDPTTSDQYTGIILDQTNKNGIHEDFSKSCEFAAIAGMNLMQPYLDYSEDPAQGDLRVKIWEYNSFVTDGYWRKPDMSDANLVWCQEYITRQEAISRFGDRVNNVTPMMGSPQRISRFYFLPENHNLNKSDLFVLSYVWYKWISKRKRLWSKKRQQFFDFSPDAEVDNILTVIEDFEIVEVETPVWKLATVLNDRLMYQGDNPLGFTKCPFIPNFWNYDPHLSHYNLRDRSLIRCMRDPQFLMNHKIISNNDIAADTINSGWKRKLGAVANEESLKKNGQGWDLVINPGYEMTDVEKIIPSQVPQSDLELANQMKEMIFATSGINLENWSGQQDKQISGLTVLLKQAANLMVFQKYFDQWDFALKLLGEIMLLIIINNWNAAKVGMILGEDPTPYFYSRIFSKFKVLVEETDLTATQQSLQAQQMFDVNAAFQREVFPPSMIIPKLNLTGKEEIIQFLQQQEQQQQQMQQEDMLVKQQFEDAKIKELYTKALNHLGNARERFGREESNIGLFEERLSEIIHNRALATKAKMESLEKLIDVISKYGEIETSLKMNQIEGFNYQQMLDENIEKQDAKETALANEFLMNIMGDLEQVQQQSGQIAQLG